MNCTIIVFHYESLAYLRAVVRQIRKFQRDDIQQRIIIADQSVDTDVIKQVYQEFANKTDVSIVHMSPWGSGYSVDFVLRNIPIYSDYICTIDVDTIPIHRNWLYVPIKLIEEANFTWVGVHAEIESAYANMGNFFCMCQHYRIGKTESYRELSVNAGFVKNDHRKNMAFMNNQWEGWSDDAVIAHWWEDQYCKHNKFTFNVTKYLGVAPTEGRYGRYTDDLVFHMGFSYNWKMVRDRRQCMGKDFIDLMVRMETDGLTDELIREILGGLRPLELPIIRIAWNGENKSIYTPNKELNALVDKLKAE